MRHPRLAGPAVTRAGHSFINPALAGMGLRGGAGNGAGNRDCFVGMELAWRACVHGQSRGKRIGGFVVESSWSAAACTARGTAQPIHGSQQLPEPLLGVSPPQPLPCSSQSSPGKRAHSGEWCWENSLMPAHRTSPRDCRLFWLPACSRVLLRASVSPEETELQNGKGDAISLKCFRWKILREKLARTGAAISIADPGQGQVLSKVRGSQLAERGSPELGSSSWVSLRAGQTVGQMLPVPTVPARI